MSDGLVSIVLPTYNGARYLRAAMESCLAQTYANLELIIVDDASTDETPAIVRGFDDPRVRYLRHETNRRLPAALNTGFAAARGAYFTWTSDDNLYAPDALHTLLDALRDGPALLAFADYVLIDEAGTPGARVRFADGFDPADGRTIGACFLYTRELAARVGAYDEEAFLAEDFDYWIRAWKETPFRHVHAAPYFYRQHGASLTAVHGKSRQAIAMSVLVQVKHDVVSPAQAATLLLRHAAVLHGKPPFLTRAAFRVLRLFTGENPYDRWNALRHRRFLREAEGVCAAYRSGTLPIAAAAEGLATLVHGTGRVYRW
jgi:glycosyltransferase involved in cell wall biosynthesis